MSIKELADEAIDSLNERMKTHVDSRCATTEEVQMAAMACRIRELEESLTYMVANIAQPVALETRDGFAKASKVLSS
ncbi:MAG: hypothetical protein KAS32_23235 [Candidatus Peribacteraceae bacterium]|nr:hypothetical protein [Candidatus Peribacteraceae bacterium]